MDKVLLSGPIGDKGNFELKVSGGKLVLSAMYHPVQGVAAGSSVELDALGLKDLLKAKIPGQVDDLLLDALYAALVK